MQKAGHDLGWIVSSESMWISRSSLSFYCVETCSQIVAHGKWGKICASFVVVSMKAIEFAACHSSWPKTLFDSN